MKDSIESIPSLREFLDAGCDLASINRRDLVCLIESVLLGCTRDLNPEMAAFNRQMAQMVLDGIAPWPRMLEVHGESYCRRTHAMMLCWGAECAEDPRMVTRLEEALPGDLGAEVAVRRELLHHPNPLLVESADDCERVVCSACGGALGDLCVTVANIEAVSYCVECITLAAEAVRAAKGAR